jgi:cytochrome c oxidase assembly protein subunit 15
MPNQVDPMPLQGRESVWPHRLAWLTAVLTFPLLFIGGLVTSKGAGLAVPDWPTTFGYNMFLYPWSEMVGGIFYEHSHRLLASGVGFATILLALSLWFREGRRWLRWLGAAALVLVVLQGVIGGLRVVLLEQTLAIIHAGFAQAFFALTVSLVVFTSRSWKAGSQRLQLPDARPIQRLCVLTTLLIYFQGLFGAVLRYTGEGLAIHLFFALVVAVHVLLLAKRVLQSHAGQAHFLRPAVLLISLLLLQLALGIGSYLGKFHPVGSALPRQAVVVLTTTHLVTGALMLVTSLVLTLRAYRFLSFSQPMVRQGLVSERVPV